jgi:acyl carrier protein
MPAEPPESAMTRSSFLDGIVGWLNRRLAPPDVVIGPDTELFSDGLIDSMRILLLIAWTERATGRPIPDADVRMDYFATPRRIAEIFAKD